MIDGVIHIIVVYLSTTIGAIAGLGGGVIIKPIFDLLGTYSATTIGFYSSISVFSMCIVSIIKQLKKGLNFDLKIIISISFGSILGGVIGDTIFQYVALNLPINQVKFIQSGLLLLVLIIILLYSILKKKIKHYQLSGILPSISIGLFLGTISVFLGIGGGPLNVSLLMYLYSFTIKEATIYSLATIFSCQLTKLLLGLVSKQIFAINLTIIPFLIVAALMGGYVGTMINQRASDKFIEKFYICLILSLIFVSAFNIYNV